MYTTNENFDAWMERIIEKLESIESRLSVPKKKRTLDGEVLLDNQDLCLLMNVSKRTLQRYRSSGKLQYKRIDQKTYYLESEVHRFIREYLNDEDIGEKKTKEPNK